MYTGKIIKNNEVKIVVGIGGTLIKSNRGGYDWVITGKGKTIKNGIAFASRSAAIDDRNRVMDTL